jgi:hypothetical protein
VIGRDRFPYQPVCQSQFDRTPRPAPTGLESSTFFQTYLLTSLVACPPLTKVEFIVYFIFIVYARNHFISRSTHSVVQSLLLLIGIQISNFRTIFLFFRTKVNDIDHISPLLTLTIGSRGIYLDFLKNSGQYISSKPCTFSLVSLFLISSSEKWMWSRLVLPRVAGSDFRFQAKLYPLF